MKKKLVLLVSLLCIAAMLFPTTVSALPPSAYTSSAEALRNDPFIDYQPTYTGTAFDGYTGPYTVGRFPVSNPKDLTTFYDLNEYNILYKDGDGVWGYGGMYLGNFGYTDNGTYISTLTRTIVVANHATAITYTAERSGLVTLSLDGLAIWNQNDDGYSDCIFGLNFAIFKNGEMIYPATGSEWKNFSTPNSLAKDSGYTFTADDRAACTLQNVAVQEGDKISFAVTRDGTNPCYHAYVLPRVAYTAYCGETYAMAEEFSGLQGSGGFYAAYSQTGKESVYTLPQYDSQSGCFGGKSNAGTVSRTGLTVKPGYDTVLLFRSPLIATYTLSASSFQTNGSLSFTADVYRADGTKTTVGQQGYTSASTAFSPITGIELDRGDVLAMRFSAESDTAVTFSPILSSTGTMHATSQNGEAFTTLPNGVALKPDIYLNAIAVSLSGNISLHFYTYFSDDLLAQAEEYGVLFFDKEQESYTYDAAYACTEATPSGDEYVYTCAGIAAKEMTDIIYARPYCKTSEGYVYGELRSASVRSYAEGLRSTYYDSTTAQGNALYTLACAMLNYGAEAQTYFNYKTGDLANSALSEEEKQTPVGEYENKIGLTGEATLSGYSFFGATLLLNDLPALRIYMQPDDGASMDGIQIEFSESLDFQNAKAYTPTWSSSVGAYGISMEGIPASKMRTTVYFRITNGTHYSRVLTYSPETYAARSHANALDSCDVVDTLFAYSDAAIRYANVSNQTQESIMITAQALVDAIRNGTVTENAVYCVSDSLPMTFNSQDSNATYDAKNITVYIDRPLTLSGADGITLSNLHLSGNNVLMTTLLVEKANNAVLDKVTVDGYAAVGIQIQNSKHVFLKGTDVAGEIGTGIIVNNTSADVYLTDATIDVKTLGIQDAGESGSYMKGNTILSDKDGVSLLAPGSELRDNRITAPQKGVYAHGASDTLVARNVVIGSIRCEGCDNTVFLKNTATSLSAVGNENLYVVSNTLSGRLTLESNNYLLADLNTEAAVTDTSNTNKNGDDVTDVNARLAAGADENLLPHVDRDQFLYHERKDTVRTADGTGKNFKDYLYSCMGEEDEVIIAPGAYKLNDSIFLNDSHSNTTIYAYGAYIEQQNGLNNIFHVYNGKNISFKGLTMGFVQQSCGQVYVLDKLADNKLLVVTGAGMMNEFGNTDPQYYNTTGMGAQREGTFYAYCDTYFNSITKNNNGTMTMDVDDNVYNMIKEGDILTCRTVNGYHTVIVEGGSENTVFYDVTVYAGTACFAFMESDNTTATTYYRVVDTTQNGVLIDENTYNTYRALEEAYGVDLEISQDADGNYRGSPAHISSVDATHTTSCGEGSQVTFCLFENMCDDGTNQNAMHGRLDEVRDNGDGTTTIIYKGNLSEATYNGNNYKPSDPWGFCADFQEGDRVYIYTSKGQLVCDAAALSATAYVGTETFSWESQGYNVDGNGTVQKRSVTVKTEYVNFDALKGFDLSDNHHRSDNKVLIDNMSRASNGFKFDNCKIQNVRSRGLLIKASDGTIKNCTFRNIGMSCIAVQYEIYWGESGVTENLLIGNNLFDHTGYFENSNYLSPISIAGLGTQADENYLLYKNIQISGNRFVDRTTNYAIYVNSAKNVKIINNDLGARMGYNVSSDLAPAIYIFCATDVTIEGNKYPDNTTSAAERFVFLNASNIHGSDANGSLSSSNMDALASSMPVISGENVTYPGNWCMGYMPVSTNTNSLPTFTPYEKYWTKYGWIVESVYDGDDDKTGNGLWSGTGGIYAAWGYGAVPTGYYNCAIRYTAPKDGTVDITLTSLADANNAYIAIFKNDEMIWPQKGRGQAYYNSGDQWYSLSEPHDPFAIIRNIRNTLTDIELKEGDRLYFVTKQNTLYSEITSAMFPAVLWHES